MINLRTIANSFTIKTVFLCLFFAILTLGLNNSVINAATPDIPSVLVAPVPGSEVESSPWIVDYSAARPAPASSGPACNGLICCANPPDCSFDELIETANKIFTFLIEIALVFVSIVFAYAGYLYLSSGGDSGKISKAHSMLTKAVIGLIVVLSAYLIVKEIYGALGGKIEGFNL